MGKGYRPGRLGEEIKKVISDLLLRELKDPRLQESMVSVTAVDVTRDGSYATVYLTVFKMGDQSAVDEAKEQVIEAMNSCKGIIKKEIGKHVRVRHTPELIFKMDESLDYGRHIDQLIDQVNKNEK